MALFVADPDRRTLVATGLAGLAGAMLLFAGDMLLYGDFGPGSGIDEQIRTVITGASTRRLIAGGVVAPFALCGYLAGVLHVYWRLRPGPRALRVPASAGLALMLILGAAVHSIWGAHALAIRALATTPAAQPLHDAIGTYLGFVYRLAEVAGYPAAVLLLLLVLIGRTSYPRWTATVNPGLLVLVSPLAEHLPAPLGAPLLGGAVNLAFVAFFLCSLATIGGQGNDGERRRSTGSGGAAAVQDA